MIQTVPETGSTNADLAARIGAGDYVAEGDWLVADRQTAGRGRHGREWRDGVGNFMGSTVVHKRFGDPEAETLALLAGLAVHEVVTRHLPEDRPACLKWPNDVLVDDAKLAGILLEAQGDSVIVGFGVNLVSAPDIADRKAVSLAEHSEAPPRDAFAADLATAFDRELERWRSYGLAPIRKRWLSHAHPVGTSLTATESDGNTITGTFAGLDDSGALRLGLADGSTRVIHAGEVLLGTSA